MLCSRKIAISLPLKRSGPPHSSLFLNSTLKISNWPYSWDFMTFTKFQLQKNFSKKLENFIRATFLEPFFKMIVNHMKTFCQKEITKTKLVKYFFHIFWQNSKKKLFLCVFAEKKNFALDPSFKWFFKNKNHKISPQPFFLNHLF